MDAWRKYSSWLPSVSGRCAVRNGWKVPHCFGTGKPIPSRGRPPEEKRSSQGSVAISVALRLLQHLVRPSRGQITRTTDRQGPKRSQAGIKGHKGPCHVGQNALGLILISTYDGLSRLGARQERDTCNVVQAPARRLPDLETLLEMPWLRKSSETLPERSRALVRDIDYRVCRLSCRCQVSPALTRSFRFSGTFGMIGLSRGKSTQS